MENVDYASNMTKKAARAIERDAELRAMLEGRRHQLIGDMNEMMRSVRTRSIDARVSADADDGTEADIQDDLYLSMIQMKAETLNRIDAALSRIDDGLYGNCVECDRAIASRRLRALPFAVRCTSCEEAREKRTRSGVHHAGRRAYSHPSFDATD